MNDADRAAVRIGALAENQRRAVTGGAAIGIAGIAKRLARDMEREPLVGLSTLDGSRHDAVLERIEHGERTEVAALLAVDAIVLARRRVVIEVGVPRLRRRIGNRTRLRDDVPPERADIGRPGIQAAEADHRNVFRRRPAARNAVHPALATRLLPCASRFSAALQLTSMPSTLARTRAALSTK